MRKQIVSTVVVAAICVLWLSASAVMGRSFTLSDTDLMSLDWYEDSRAPDDPNVARIVAKRDVSGTGVEFDIYFPKGRKDSPNTYSVYYVSCKRGGEGTLVGIDVNDYDAFALKFSLVAVDGNSSPGVGGSLVVGAIIDSGYTWAYSLEIISFAEDEKSIVISSTTTDADKISIIGFTIRKLSPQGWNPAGTTVTVRVEAAPGAEILP
jgi:hypothetical protein